MDKDTNTRLVSFEMWDELIRQTGEARAYKQIAEFMITQALDASRPKASASNPLEVLRAQQQMMSGQFR